MPVLEPTRTESRLDHGSGGTVACLRTPPCHPTPHVIVTVVFAGWAAAGLGTVTFSSPSA
jgi:hypothetical protein